MLALKVIENLNETWMTNRKIQFVAAVHYFICEFRGNIFASGNMVTAFFQYLRTVTPYALVKAQ